MKLCNLEIAKALHELGYDGEYQYCHICTQHDGYQLMTASECEKYAGHIVTLCAAPRLDDAAYWLRERYGLLIYIIYLHYCRLYNPRISDMYGYYDSNAYYPDSARDYDSALENAVMKAIQIVKDKKI